MIDFSEMLPVGMIANGGQVAQILAELAKRQRNLPDWEAFHYERSSESSFELTGGIVSIGNGGAKRWLEPHECISISLEALIVEMQKQGLFPSQNPTNIPALSHPAVTESETAALVTDVLYLNLTLTLPSDEIGRQRILRAFHLHSDFFGAQVIACSLTK
jgi:hypothetical protein